MGNTSRRYTPADKEQAVRLVRTLREEIGTSHGTVPRIADQLGIGVESLRGWVKQAAIDDGAEPGVTLSEAARIKALETVVVDRLNVCDGPAVGSAADQIRRALLRAVAAVRKRRFAWYSQCADRTTRA
jgi:transposase-like protein